MSPKLQSRTKAKPIGFMSMSFLERTDFDALAHRFKVQLFNSVVGHKNACLIATENQFKQSNLAIFNSLVHIGSSPPLLGVIFRPDSVERHTYENILETKSYTVNLISEKDIASAHQTSARYPRTESEFKVASLAAAYKDGFHAPYVESSPVSFGLEFRENIPLEINGTNLVIGEVKWLKFPQEILEPDGFADLTKAGIVGCIGLDAYTLGTIINRFEYAKTDKPPQVKA